MSGLHIVFGCVAGYLYYAAVTESEFSYAGETWGRVIFASFLVWMSLYVIP